MQTLLLVEDDHKLAGMVLEFLRGKGFAVLHEADGAQAVRRILDEKPDLVILDVMLPSLSGLDVCRLVRPRYVGPILMLTALGDEVEEVVGLEVGADDYVTKPVRPRVLLARIAALLRRARPPSPHAHAPTREPLAIGGLTIDAASRSASLDGQAIELTTAEFDLLHYLATHAGHVVSREQICRDLRGVEWDGLDRAIDIRITRLRRKLGDRGKQPELIKSVRGEGYLMSVRR